MAGKLPASLRTNKSKTSLEERIEEVLSSHSTLLYGDSDTGKTFESMSWQLPIVFEDTESRGENTRLLQYDGNPDIFSKKFYQP